ncbi:GTP-binding protein [Bacillus sp. FJAT-50079]|uniref:CobW family GTP-binding protein n=1 Tax=Bacillus sp. FJAT-50079 TaxID=2833577 RepID=UPI001BC98565|nr:GTP-binding protein [Bacillus sp. FJAT-50079]MBS4209495.1 GTP-binding protein [Bacillus sp. FJAT-50079]
MKKNQRTPVYVLSGFLGSGKTTVLLHMLKQCKEQGLRPGIILNELGETNVEGHLFKNENVYELLNGCICCTIQDDLKETMDELILQTEKEAIDILFIEGTGVANPLEIQEVLFSRPYMERFELMSVITVLDASHFLEFQSVFSSSSELRTLLKEQMICGSLLLLNKTDLIRLEQLEKVKSKIQRIVGDDKKLIESTFGKVDSDQLLKKRIRSILMGSEGEYHHHHSTVQMVKLEEVPPLKQKIFEKWLKQLPCHVLRGKGYVQIDGSDQLFSFQYASGKSAFMPVSAGFNRKPVIILIGIDIDVEQMKKDWKQLAHSK